MKKAAAKRRMTTTSEDDVQRRLAIFEARKQFLDLALNMSWQLAITVLLPVFIGVQIDNHYHTSPSWTIIGVFAGVFMAVIVVANTLRMVRKAQESDKKEKK